jgi:hypothetical protein
MVMARSTRCRPRCRSRNDPTPDSIPSTCMRDTRRRSITRFGSSHGRACDITYESWTRVRIPQSWYLGYRTDGREQPVRTLGVLRLFDLPGESSSSLLQPSSSNLQPATCNLRSRYPIISVEHLSSTDFRSSSSSDSHSCSVKNSFRSHSGGVFGRSRLSRFVTYHIRCVDGGKSVGSESEDGVAK